ncbi:uncharacterized protein LOC131803874 [Musca domestica]|uniref:Uncharacterized protein LOC131803874 n=1 Tax=Musca domestica TaxID=7370 RepID=A0ABM3V7A4_MUSDO|nr:uncharacterized protein LOC131803874 [Musca domestica]
MPLLEDIVKTNLTLFYMYHGTALGKACMSDIVFFDFFASPLEVGVDLVQQMTYLETYFGESLMEKVDTYETPKGIVIKSNPFAAAADLIKMNAISTIMCLIIVIL